MSSQDTITSSPKHWIIRVNDGENFKNSKFPFWGLKQHFKGTVKKFQKGDILWFLTSKKFGGKFIGMAEYTCFYDQKDEPLIQINTYSNEDQNWTGDGNWSLQIHYKNLYLTEKQNITAIIKCAGVILDYDTFKEKNIPDLPMHYKNYKFYAEPVEK